MDNNTASASTPATVAVAPVSIAVTHDGSPKHRAGILQFVGAILAAEIPVVLQLVHNPIAQGAIAVGLAGAQAAMQANAQNQ